VTAYLIFEERDEAYTVIGQADEGDAQAAIRAVAAETVTEQDVGRKFWATPARSWRGLAVRTKVVVDTTPLSLPEGDEVTAPEEPESAPEETPAMEEEVSL